MKKNKKKCNCWVGYICRVDKKPLFLTEKQAKKYIFFYALNHCFKCGKGLKYEKE